MCDLVCYLDRFWCEFRANLRVFQLILARRLLSRVVVCFSLLFFLLHSKCQMIVRVLNTANKMYYVYVHPFKQMLSMFFVYDILNMKQLHYTIILSTIFIMSYSFCPIFNCKHFPPHHIIYDAEGKKHWDLDWTQNVVKNYTGAREKFSTE